MRTVFVLINVIFTNPNLMNMTLFPKSNAVNLKSLVAMTLMSAGLMLQSCSKDPEPAPEVAYLSITNTSPTAGTYNIYVDQTQLNTGGAVAFNGSTGYFQILPGNHNIRFNIAGRPEGLINKDIPLVANTVTSVFLINQAPNLDFLVVKDTIGNVGSTKAFVRFINLSPDAPALDLAVKDGAVIVADKTFKASSSFLEIDAKAYVFEFRNKTSGTSTVLPSTDLVAGKSYTILSTGLITPGDAGRPFGSKIIINQ